MGGFGGSWGSGSGSLNFATSRYERGSHWGAGTSAPAANRVAAPVSKQRVQQNKDIVIPKVGQQVKHASFGQGTVLALEGAGDKTVAKVQFQDSEKRLLLRYAPLELVDG